MADTLNPAQKRIVETTEGPVLVIAGPGSGKTKTLVERVVHLLENGVKPEQLMVATFTVKAAKELLTRISNILLERNIDVNPNDIYLGTLHSIFLRFIEDHQEYSRIKRNYRLLDPFEQAFIVYSHINEFKRIDNIDLIINPNEKKYVNSWNAANTIVKRVNTISEEAIPIADLENSSDLAIRVLAECHKLYLRFLEEENALDFSTIQSEMLRMLHEEPSVLQAIQDQIRYFMIDEYQDTNTVQERILLELCSRDNNICVVGDDDQGLYRFRGASIRNILEFANNFEDGLCQTIYLTTNYRSHPEIIKFYNDYMRSQDWSVNGKFFRFDKSIEPCAREFPDTASVVRLSAASELDEEYYHEVLRFIQTLQDSGKVTDLNQITFLYRSVKGNEPRGLMTFLEAHGINVFSPRSDMFFTRPEIRYLIGALLSVFPQVIDDGIDPEDDTPHVFVRNENFYNFLADIQNDFMAEVGKNPKDHRGLIAWIMSLQNKHTNLDESTDYAFSQLIYELFKFPLFAKYLDVELTERKQDLRPAYNIGIFLNLVSKFEFLYDVAVFTPKHLDKTLRNFFGEYLRFLHEGGLEEYEDFDETTPSGCISFMTIHQAKGLEFPITIVGSLGASPRKSYDDLDQLLQDEYFDRPPFEPIEQVKFYDFWRLYYTAFSRAQNVLVLTGREHGGQMSLPSKYFKRFWDEVPSWDNDTAFDIAKLQLAEVKPTNIKHEYAFTSHILLFEDCPRKYKFYKELEFTEIRQGGMIGGTLLHETIEDIHRAVLRGEEHILTDENITGWFNTNYNQLVKSQHGFLHQAQRDALLHQVLHYRDVNNGEWQKIREAEVDVSLVKEDYILKGKIDLVRGENDTVELIDFKSGDKPDVNTQDPFKRKMLQQYRRQLEVYAYIVQQRTGLKISKMHLYYPREENGNPRITFSYVPDFVQNTISSFEEVVRKIERKDFSMEGHQCNEKVCRECDLRHYCHKM